MRPLAGSCGAAPGYARKTGLGGRQLCSAALCSCRGRGGSLMAACTLTATLDTLFRMISFNLVLRAAE